MIEAILMSTFDCAIALELAIALPADKRLQPRPLLLRLGEFKIVLRMVIAANVAVCRGTISLSLIRIIETAPQSVKHGQPKRDRAIPIFLRGVHLRCNSNDVRRSRLANSIAHESRDDFLVQDVAGIDEGLGGALRQLLKGLHRSPGRNEDSCRVDRDVFVEMGDRKA